MNVLILGNGDRELGWARWLRDHPSHRLVGVYPGFATEGLDPLEVPPSPDLEAALAIPDVDLAVVGGPSEARMESLRRVASLGWPAICIHPPGPDSEAYYQVSLSREETGAVIVPDLPSRLHPAVSRVKRALDDGSIGSPQGILLIAPRGVGGPNTVKETFSELVDVVRAIAGEVESLWAIGRPSGDSPPDQLTVFLDMAGGLQAQIGISASQSDPMRLVAQGDRGKLDVRFPGDASPTARFEWQPKAGPAEVQEFDDWDPHAEIFEVLLVSLGKREIPSRELPSPNLDDGIRAMELTEAVARSIKRERKVNLHYQSIGEEANFKSVMTSTGCLLLLAILFLLPLSLAGRALGLPWLIYISYLIPLMLGGFILLQILRFAVRKPPTGQDHRHLDGFASVESSEDD